MVDAYDRAEKKQPALTPTVIDSIIRSFSEEGSERSSNFPGASENSRDDLPAGAGAMPHLDCIEFHDTRVGHMEWKKPQSSYSRVNRSRFLLNHVDHTFSHSRSPQLKRNRSKNGNLLQENSANTKKLHTLKPTVLLSAEMEEYQVEQEWLQL